MYHFSRLSQNLNLIYSVKKINIICTKSVILIKLNKKRKQMIMFTAQLDQSILHPPLEKNVKIESPIKPLKLGQNLENEYIHYFQFS
jgi:hypothetical protein